MENVIIEGKKVFTVIPEKFEVKSIYGEKMVKRGNRTLRTWNPYRSKLSAALLLGVKIDVRNDFSILYLGAATGTTVSHLSDIVYRGTIYAVEISSIPMKTLLDLSKIRKNVIPIMEDANHPDRYLHIVPEVDFIYQDIAQRNQIEIFIKNCKLYLKDKGSAIMMVKARSIDVSVEPLKVYEKVLKEIKKNGYGIEQIKKLDPYAKDHACIVVRGG